ncbi:MAG TPA: flavin reductase family protein [Candidatus Krumholzibacterium sp.]|nr:flavin reductase family protein [Candidatus Krumholzibacterium sp.]
MTSSSKIEIGGSFILAPVLVVLVGCAHEELGRNLITIAWTGVDCGDPMMAHVSIRPPRHSYRMVRESGCFTINIPTVDNLEAVDYCGITSGSKVDKFERTGLTAVDGSKVAAPIVAECPINLECEVRKVVELGLHHMFIGEVVARHADRSCIGPDGKIDASKLELLTYIHGEYWSLGRRLERAGFALGRW